MHVLLILQDAVLVAVLVAATSDPVAGRPVNPDLSYDERVEVFSALVVESRRHDLDPVLVAAVAWAESDLRPRLVSRSDDYCYLQVHWFEKPLNIRRGETWLVGITHPDELLDVETCAQAGVAELAFWHGQCRSSRRTWWQCYKWGYREPLSDRYARRVAERRRWLQARIRRVTRAWERGGEV